MEQKPKNLPSLLLETDKLKKLNKEEENLKRKKLANNLYAKWYMERQSLQEKMPLKNRFKQDAEKDKQFRLLVKKMLAQEVIPQENFLEKL